MIIIINLYDISVSLCEDGFSTTILDSEVISYEKNGMCKAAKSYYTISLNSSELDKYKTGLIHSTFPSLSISTIKKENIDEYILEMEEMIKSELVERLNRTQSQLDSIS